MSANFRNVGLLSGLLACAVCASAGTLPATRKPAAPKTAPQPAAEQQSEPAQQVAPAVPEAASVPEQLPATPPKVSLNGGQLSIVADNSTLGDVLNAVKKLTGAGLEIPNAASYERIVAQLGPGLPQQVLQQLLTGSKFDYIILGSADNPDAIQKIILTPRSGGNGSGGNASSGNMAANRPPVNNQPAYVNQPEQDNGVDDEIQQEPPQEPMQPEPPPPQTEEPQQPPQGMQPNTPNGPKTPEQLLQELQRLQQQGQAGRPPQ